MVSNKRNESLYSDFLEKEFLVSIRNILFYKKTKTRQIYLSCFIWVKLYWSSFSISPEIFMEGLSVFAPADHFAGHAVPGLASMNWSASILRRSSSELRPRGPLVTSIPRQNPCGSMMNVPRPAIPDFSSRILYALAISVL